MKVGSVIKQIRGKVKKMEKQQIRENVNNGKKENKGESKYRKTKTIKMNSEKSVKGRKKSREKVNNGKKTNKEESK